MFLSTRSIGSLSNFQEDNSATSRRINRMTATYNPNILRFCSAKGVNEVGGPTVTQILLALMECVHMAYPRGVPPTNRGDHHLHVRFPEVDSN